MSYFESEMKQALEARGLPEVPDYLKQDASFTVIEQAAKENERVIAELERQQSQVRSGNQFYNGSEISQALAKARQERNQISARLLTARSQAEQATKAEQAREQAAKAAEAREAKLTAQLRAAWSGSEASFQAALPAMLQAHLTKEAESNIDRVKASMRARFGAY